jgi:hypothetical protein
METCDLPLISAVCGTVGGVASSTGQAFAASIGAWIAESMGDLAASAADLASRAVDETTAIDLNARWFRDNYELLLPIGLVLTVATFCLQLVHAACRRDERALAQAAWGTMTGVLFSFCAVSFTTVAITVVDALSRGLFQAANTSTDDAVRRLLRVSQLSEMNSLGWAVPAFVALGFAIGSFVYWGVMVARKVGVLVLVALAVFAGAGGGWEAAKRWRRGWIEATATLVVSKLLMTVVFLIGVSAVGTSDISGGLGALSDAIAGIVILILVLLCPYATYKFVRWASDGGGHDEVHNAGVAGLATIGGTAKTAGTLAVQMHTGSAPAPQGPSRVPGMRKDGVASGIDPTGRVSKEGIDAGPPQPQTTFRYGEDPDQPGDKGRALIQRPGLPPLITRPSNAEPGGSADTPSTGGASVAQPSDAVAPTGPIAHAGPVTPVDPAEPTTPGAGPPSTGSPRPTRWKYPNQPPSTS